MSHLPIDMKHRSVIVSALFAALATSGERRCVAGTAQS